MFYVRWINSISPPPAILHNTVFPRNEYKVYNYTSFKTFERI